MPIRQECGVTASIGVSFTRTFAKLASEIKKLESACIRTIGQLAQTDLEFLKYRLGVNGLLVHAFANGEDTDPVGATGWRPEVKSIGNSTTTPRDLTSEEDIRLIASLLSESRAECMREKGFICRTVQIWIRYNDLSSFHCHFRPALPG